MTLSSGTKLGPYEVVTPIGAGGMGEVYRARDERLKRDVAVKVLPASFAQDPERLRRFEQEAQTAGGLNHPNITAVYDIGSLDGSPYIVTELLEGETLRSRVSGGALPVRKASDYAMQIARGLAAAHEKSIVHRDLKPENLFLTRDGRVKILDFGLAKLTQPDGPAREATNLPTATAGTEPGVVLGTLGYMSPEQVKGKQADARSDIFSFGAVLYEMLSGSRAFQRDSAAETMSAILREEPPDLSATNKNVPPGLDRIVRHCLEKNPEERFHSAHDLAFDLQALSDQTGVPAATLAGSAARRVRVPWGALAGALVGLAAGYFLFQGRGAAKSPAFHQLTFRRGTVWSARFGADGKTALYSASWDGSPTEVFVSSPGSPESRPLGIAGADVLAVSPSGDLAISLNSRVSTEFTRTGTLARVSATGGGAPRQVLEEVDFADWTPDGKDLAVVRAIPSGGSQLEYPIGKKIYETPGWIGNPRISRDGTRVAFIDHPIPADDGGFAAVMDRAGKKTRVSPLFSSVQGIAWSPDGSEVWFTGAEAGNRSLYGATLSGKVRLLTRVTGSLTLQDVAADGRVLLIDEMRRLGLSALPPGETKERDLSWLDWSRPQGLTADGRTVLFYESGEGGGAGYTTYVRGTDGSPAVRLSEGQGLALSPDGRWVVALLHKQTNPEVVLYPTGAGQPRPLPIGKHQVIGGVRFLPDSRRFLFFGNAPGQAGRVFLGDLDGSTPRAVTPGNDRGPLVPSSTGKRFVAGGPNGRRAIYSIDGGEPTPIVGLQSGELVLGWTSDDLGIFVQSREAPAGVVDRLDPATGRRELWKRLLPSDATGVVRVSSIYISPDASFYVYAYSRVLSNLYLVEGLK